ncbi:MAG: ATP-binding protein [Kofleriaceae bacterium]
MSLLHSRACAPRPRPDCAAGHCRPPRTEGRRGRPGGPDPLRLSYPPKPKLLVVDELGYLPLEKQTAHLFFQLVSRRYERGSMLITSIQTTTQWGHVFGDEVIAAAVLDWVLHHSHVLVIQGEIFRLRQK